MCIFHKFKDVKTQVTKGVGFGLAGCEVPGMRVVKICSKCNKKRYVSLNLAMPNRYLYYESIWSD